MHPRGAGVETVVKRFWFASSLYSLPDITCIDQSLTESTPKIAPARPPMATKRFDNPSPGFLVAEESFATWTSPASALFAPVLFSNGDDPTPTVSSCLNSLPWPALGEAARARKTATTATRAMTTTAAMTAAAIAMSIEAHLLL